MEKAAAEAAPMRSLAGGGDSMHDGFTKKLGVAKKLVDAIDEF